LIGLTIKKNKKQFNAITLLDFKGAVNGRIRFFESARSNNETKKIPRRTNNLNASGEIGEPRICI